MSKNCRSKNKNKAIWNKSFILECMNIKELIIKLEYIYLNNKNFAITVLKFINLAFVIFIMILILELSNNTYN